MLCTRATLLDAHLKQRGYAKVSGLRGYAKESGTYTAVDCHTWQKVQWGKRTHRKVRARGGITKKVYRRRGDWCNTCSNNSCKWLGNQLKDTML